MCRLCAALGALVLLGCSAKPPTHLAPSPPLQGGGRAGDGLTLLDASFATAVQDREPVRVAPSLSAPVGEAAELLFWMELTCQGSCAKQLATNGQVVVYLDWYREERGLLLKQATTALPLKATRWRTWGKKRISAGNWVAVLRDDQAAWLCLRQQCFFSITVTP